LAIELKCSRRTLIRQFSQFWHSCPKSNKNYKYNFGILVCDAIYLEGRKEAVLIGKTLSGIVHWLFAFRENYFSWRLFFCSIKTPKIIVCDGQKGMLSAIKDVFPQTRIQRCHFHVLHRARMLLTKNPKTIAGIKLNYIIKKLNKIRTRRQKRRWIRLFNRWNKKHDKYLKERSLGVKPSGKQTWWYTHKRLRSCRSLIKNALPCLFTYIGHHQIPRTTNHVEGGINSRLKELIRRLNTTTQRITNEKQKSSCSSFFTIKTNPKTSTKCHLTRVRRPERRE